VRHFYFGVDTNSPKCKTREATIEPTRWIVAAQHSATDNEHRRLIGPYSIQYLAMNGTISATKRTDRGSVELTGCTARYTVFR
jgi:hypothetical protein